MSKLKVTALIAVLLVVLLLASQALAMSSANFRLDWFTPLTGGGGGPTSSIHYAANFTVGQTAIGPSQSPNAGSGLGYWYGLVSSIVRNFRSFLPQMIKN